MAIKVDAKQKLRHSLADRFSIELKRRLAGHSTKSIERCGAHKYYRLKGCVRLESFGELKALVGICVDSDWRTKPPFVFCKEFWIRQNTDWHVNENGSLCWVLGDQWRDAISNFEQLTSGFGVCEAASHFLIRNVSYLLDCHRVGHERAIREWDQNWSAFLHGSRGVDQYKLEFEEIRKQESGLLEEHER